MKERFGIGSIVLAVMIAVSSCSGKSGSDQQAAPPKMPDAVAVATIFPQPAHANNPLTVKLPGRGTNPADYVFAWSCNGVVIESVDGPTLDPGHFRRGDRVSVEITPRDANGIGDAQRASVQIANTPPKLISAATFMGTNDRPEIFAKAESQDVDGDAVTYSYRWFKNGQVIDRETGSVLDPKLVRRGDRVYAEVTASDGMASSPPLGSEAITIENHAPRISSTPVGPAPTDETFHYKVIADDPDSDPLTYELVSAPEGMSVDDEGNVVWVLPPAGKREGQNTIKIKVSDPNGGAAIQEFSLSFVKRDQNKSPGRDSQKEDTSSLTSTALRDSI